MSLDKALERADRWAVDRHVIFTVYRATSVHAGETRSRQLRRTHQRHPYTLALYSTINGA